MAAVIQFYFDRFLPIDDSWPDDFEFVLDDCRVLIAPRLPAQPPG